MLKDLRYAFRTLRKNPAFVLIAISSLAIGIGANSAIYSLADAMLLRALPVPEPSRVVTVNPISSGLFGGTESISYPDYVDLRDRNRTFAGLVASTSASFGFAPDRATQPRVRYGMFVSGNLFHVLGVEPALGRGFLPSEDQAPGRDAVVVLSHDLWVGDFGAKPSVIGQKIWLSGTEFTIIGVTPEKFTGLGEIKPSLFVPLAMAAKLWTPEHLTQRDRAWLEVRGRLKPGTGIQQAHADIEAIAAALRRMYPKTDANLRLAVQTELQVRAQRSPPDTMLLVMMGLLALCVLLIACANVAGLLLSRAAARAREIAVRLAVGANRKSLVRQLLIENLLLALAGGAAGLLIALGAVQFFSSIPIPTDVPIDLNIQLDKNALLFTAAVAVISTFVFGLVPALKATKLDLTEALKEKGGTASQRSRLWGRNLIVIGQVALSLVLLIISGVLLDGFQSELNQGPGFRTDHLQLMSFDPGLVHYSEARRDLFFKQLLDEVRLAPGVKSAALTSSIPMSMAAFNTISVIPEGHQLPRGEHAVTVFDSVITPGYFETMGVPIVSGRAFADRDNAKAPAIAIVNEQFAKHYWPGKSAIGKRIRLDDSGGKQLEVIGVAKTTKYLWISESPTDYLYLPFLQKPQSDMVLVAQSREFDAATLVPVLRQIVQKIDRNMPVFEVRTMRSLYSDRAVATPRIITKTIGAMGCMALVLSIIGLYGIVSYAASRRTREFGVRMAVGADRMSVVQLVLRQGLRLGAIGVTIGLVVGILAIQAITSSLMFSFRHVGPMSFIAVSVLLLMTIVVAAYIPARRASLIDPMRALREE